MANPQVHVTRQFSTRWLKASARKANNSNDSRGGMIGGHANTGILFTLPPEVRFEIAKYLQLPDLNSWSLTCREFNASFRSTIYARDVAKRDVTFPARHEGYSLALLWACLHGEIATLNLALEAGASVCISLFSSVFTWVPANTTYYFAKQEKAPLFPVPHHGALYDEMPKSATALYLALACRQEEVANCLLASGANPSMRSCNLSLPKLPATSYSWGMPRPVPMPSTALYAMLLPMRLAISPDMVRSLHNTLTVSTTGTGRDEEHDSPLICMVIDGAPIGAMKVFLDLYPASILRYHRSIMVQAFVNSRLDVVRLLLERGITLEQLSKNTLNQIMGKLLLDPNANIDTLVRAELMGLVVDQVATDYELTLLWLGYCLCPYMPGAVIAQIIACALRRYPGILLRVDKHQEATILLSTKDNPGNEDLIGLSKRIIRDNAEHIISSIDVRLLHRHVCGDAHYANMFKMMLGGMGETYLESPAVYPEIILVPYWARMLLERVLSLFPESANLKAGEDLIIRSMWTPGPSYLRSVLKPPQNIIELARKVIAAKPGCPSSREISHKTVEPGNSSTTS